MKIKEQQSRDAPPKVKIVCMGVSRFGEVNKHFDR